MIFLSHNSKDKPVIEQLAMRLAAIFGRENIFYDAWSIQPGDGIVDKMDEGLAKCEFFFFFVSENSLTSQMVKLEWQAALMKSSGGKCRFIPVRISDCNLPAILKSTLYIDLFTNGLDACVGQLVNVIQGGNTFTPSHQGFSNLGFRIIENTPKKVVLDVLATQFLEPIAHFLVLHHNKENEINVSLPQEGASRSGYNEGIRLNNGVVCNAHFIAPMGRGITPPMPLRISIEAVGDNSVHFDGILHQKAPNQFEPIPPVA
jgi:hypothetical protein